MIRLDPGILRRLREYAVFHAVIDEMLRLGRRVEQEAVVIDSSGLGNDNEMEESAVTDSSEADTNRRVG